MPIRNTPKQFIHAVVVVSLFFVLLTGVFFGSGYGIASATEPVNVTTEHKNVDIGAPVFQSQKIFGSFSITGEASYYADDFHGRRTANGQRFDMNGFTAAHKTLPFGTLLRVTNPHNNTSILVMVNDRGPYARDRVLDLSRAAARSIDITLGHVTVQGFKPNEFTHDSTVIGFTAPDYTAYKMASNALDVVEECPTFSEAMRRHRLLAAKQSGEPLYLVIRSGAKHGAKEYLVASVRKNDVEQFDATQLLTE